MSFISDYANSCTEMEMLEVTERVVSNKVAHLSYEFDTIMREHAENLALIDEKLVTESATENDAFVLYEAEAEEVKKKSRGILGSIFHAIGQLFKKIKEFLFGKSDAIDENQLPEEIELPADPNKLMAEGNEVMNGLKGFLAGNKGKVAAIAGSAIAGIGAFMLGKGKVKATVKNLEEYSDKFLTDAAEIEKSLEGVDATPEELADAKKASGKLTQIGNHIMKILKAIPHMGSQQYKNIAADNKEKANEEKEAKAGNDNSEKIDQQGKLQNAAADDASKTDTKIEALVAENEKLQSEIDNATKAIKNAPWYKQWFSKEDRETVAARKRLAELEKIPAKKRTASEAREFRTLWYTIGKKDKKFADIITKNGKLIEANEKEIAKLEKRFAGDVAAEVKADQKKEKLEAKTESAYDSLMSDIVDMF